MSQNHFFDSETDNCCEEEKEMEERMQQANNGRCACSRCRVIVIVIVLLVVLSVGVLIIAFCTHSSVLSSGLWLTTKASIRARFPNVQHVGTEQAHKYILQHGDSLLLLDARSEEEFEVSHLQKALNLPNNSSLQLMELILTKYNHSVVMTYCSAGWRSALLAQRVLEVDGERPVYNMIGSIFEWANERRPMVDSNNQPITVVHPFNQVFGRLLNRELWSHDP